jgi:16S rRNA processing protein RimM
MGFNDCPFWGTVVKTHGIKGHLIVRCNDNFLFKKNQPDIIYLEENQQLVSQEVIELSLNYPYAKVLFKNISSINEASLFLKKKVFVPDYALKKSDLPYKHELIGIHVTDERFGYLGAIDHILDFPSQQIAVIKVNNKEVLLPLVKAFFKNFDPNQKLLSVVLPDGLIDLYLN